MSFRQEQDTSKTQAISHEGSPADALAVSAESERRQSEPLVFLPAPKYPIVHCPPVSPDCGWMQHGGVSYSLFDANVQDKLYQALQLRCHHEDRLVHRKFLTPANYLSWLEVRLPAGIVVADFSMTPNTSSSRSTRRVVAIDCEMVGVGSGVYEGGREKERSELAKLCAVDVLTGEVLIDKLVLPRERVIDWRTRFSGVSYPKILAAKDSGRLLRGWQAARAELLRYVHADTILIGHELYNDLHILRLAHGRVIDTAVQTAEAVYGNMERFGRIWGLKDLAKSLLGMVIQAGKKKGHDCVEDALATRELALWCICHPAELQVWAVRMRTELENQRIERQKKLEAERKQREAKETENDKMTGADQGWSPVPLALLEARRSS